MEIKLKYNSQSNSLPLTLQLNVNLCSTICVNFVVLFIILSFDCCLISEGKLAGCGWGKSTGKAKPSFIKVEHESDQAIQYKYFELFKGFPAEHSAWENGSTHKF